MAATACGTTVGDRLLGLELLRFLAALTVLVFHYQHFAFVGTDRSGVDVAEQPLHGLLALVYREGHLGVQVFWCLSGFIFAWKYRDLIRSGAVGGRRFFVLRWSRLYPLHLATLAVVAVLQLAYAARVGDSFVYGGSDALHYAQHLLLANGWVAWNDFSYNGPTWSVSLEVLVYVAFFVFLRHVSASMAVNVLVIGVWAVASPLGLASKLLEALAFFYAGGLAASVLRRWGGTRAAAPLRAAAFAGACAGTAALTVDRLPFLVVFLAVTTAVVYLAGAADWRAGSATARHGVEALGNLTYASYLLHFPVQLAVATVCVAFDLVIPVRATWFLLLYLAVTLWLSSSVHRHFEVPAQRSLRRRLLPPRSQAVVPAPRSADEPHPGAVPARS